MIVIARALACLAGTPGIENGMNSYGFRIAARCMLWLGSGGSTAPVALKCLMALWLLLWMQPRLEGAENHPVFGPLYSEFSLTLDIGRRTEIAGSLLRFENIDTEKNWALSPILFHREDAQTDYEEFDFLYPILTFDRFGAERRLQLFQLLSWSGGNTQAEQPQRRFSLFPFYFQQRSSDPAKNYTALMPFYGHLQNRLFRDEVRFVLVPLYLQSRKKDVVTDNYLFPFFHLRHGDNLQGWQFWPLMGVETKGLTTRTNVADEIVSIGGHQKLFVAWPFFFHNKLGIGTTNELKQDVLLPLYSIQRSPARDSSSYLWPLGLTITEDREKKYREIGMPWPLVTFARGEGKTVNRVWPLFGEARNPILESDFYFWPVYKYNRATVDPLDRERLRIFFFLYSDITERNTQTKTALRRTDIWPLITARRDHNGNERVQFLAPLEPFLPNNKSIERNYSPVWSIWRSETNAQTGNSSQSFLWNLYRTDAATNSRKGSLLFGLFRYETSPKGTHWRLLGAPGSKSASTSVQSRQ